MARSRKRSNKYEREPRELNIDALMGYTTRETTPDGIEFKVHHIRSAAKEYICPGCNGVIPVGQAHVVAWTDEHFFGAQAGQRERRHWHTGCWNSRGRRGQHWY